MSKNTNTDYNFSFIISQFRINGQIAEIEPYGMGHIHDTFRLINKQPDSPDYLLQRMNHHVFKNIPGLMENIELVTSHLRKKSEAVPGADPEKEVLTLIPLKNDNSFFKDSTENYWRIYKFLEGTKSCDMVQFPKQAYEGGKAFGKFQALLADLDVDLLHETIPHFHDVENRLRLFREALQKDPKGRVSQVQGEINFVEERAESMSRILALGRQGKLPTRITHNDTKFNNVLLNEFDEAQCVIDLDTVMPGYVAYDFGDAIRTTVNKAPEDEKDTEKIAVDIELFEAFTRGFLGETKGIITDEEVKSLSLGILLLPYIMGLRFLTDYIDGDNYYKIQFAEHNLQRARAQFKLVEKLEEKQELLNKIIDDATENVNHVERK